MRVEERLLKYVSYWTTSDGENEAVIPSSDREWTLGRELKAELIALGLEKVTITDQCYVYGLLPATEGMEDKMAIGFISHMDTSPAFPGRNVKPQIIPDYDGEDVLLKGSGTWLKTKDFPGLKKLKGRTLITTDGTTLLGADDKAGIAEIITAAETIIRENIPHGDIWIGFTPDEEIGRGPDAFDLDYFKADYGFTVDGDYEGEVAYENFNAASAAFHIKGNNVHPGEAKNIMINAALIAAEIAGALPEDQTPGKTEGREGFYHLIYLSGDVNEAHMYYIIRDHDKKTFEDRKEFLRITEKKMQEKYGAERVQLELKDDYANMIEVMEDRMDIVEAAREAICEAGMEPLSRAIRGGTDGARLSFMGLPCPNLGTGGYGFHGPYEHISVEGMEKVVQILIYLASHPITCRDKG